MSTEITPRPCSIARALDVVGERWSLLALREVFLGERRFDQIVANTGASRDILAARLRKLVDAGVLERVKYQDRPARFEYHLTRAGQDLQPVLMSLMHWGDTYLAGDQPPPAVWEHDHDHVLVPQLSCAKCKKPVRRGSLRNAA